MAASGRRLLLGFVIVFPLVTTLWLGYSQEAFGTWNPMDPPARITYCGTTFVPDPTGTYLTKAQIDALDKAGPLQQVGFTASGAAIYAKPVPESVTSQLRRQYPGITSWPCATYVYLRIGTDAYRWYLQTAIAV